MPVDPLAEKRDQLRRQLETVNRKILACQAQLDALNAQKTGLEEQVDRITTFLDADAQEA